MTHATSEDEHPGLEPFSEAVAAGADVRVGDYLRLETLLPNASLRVERGTVTTISTGPGSDGKVRIELAPPLERSSRCGAIRRQEIPRPTNEAKAPPYGFSPRLPFRPWAAACDAHDGPLRRAARSCSPSGARSCLLASASWRQAFDRVDAIEDVYTRRYVGFYRDLGACRAGSRA